MADFLDGMQHAHAVAVRGIDGNDVHLGFHQGADAGHGIAANAHGGGAQQAAVRIARAVGILGGLFDILDSDQAAEVIMLIHDGQFFNAVAGQDGLGLLKRGTHGRGDQVFLGHHFANLAVIIGFKAEIAVGQDAHQTLVFGDGHAADAIFAHHQLGVGNQVRGRQEKGIGDYAVLAALYLIHLRGLLGNGHIFVDYTHAALASQRDGHLGLGDGIHGGGKNGNIQLDFACQLDGQIGVLGQHLALARYQQNIVERQALSNMILQHLQQPPLAFFPF